MYQILREHANTLEMENDKIFINWILFVWLCITMDEVIKEIYESNFGSAYETYKEAVKIIILYFKM